MTVVFVNSTRKWGGVKSWILDYGRALRDRGHRVVVVARSGTPFVDACRTAGLEVHPFHFGPKYNPAAIWRLGRVLRAVGAGVVVVNISRDLDVGAVAARMGRVPVVHRVGLVEDYRGTWEERLRHRWLVTRVLVPSVRMRDRLLARFSWISPSEVWSVPNAKPLEQYRPPSPGAAGTVVFGTASQLSPSKGHGYLLEAFARVAADGRPVRLRVAGTGGLERTLRERAAALGVADLVEFCGFVRDVPRFLSTLDAYVLPSLKEGFPNSLLEAVCAGLPVVATRLDGVEEMLDGRGLLCDPGDAQALGEAMGRLARDEGLRRRLGAAASELARQRYDVRKRVLDLESRLLEVARR